MEEILSVIEGMVDGCRKFQLRAACEHFGYNIGWVRIPANPQQRKSLTGSCTDLGASSGAPNENWRPPSPGVADGRWVHRAAR